MCGARFAAAFFAFGVASAGDVGLGIPSHICTSLPPALASLLDGEAETDAHASVEAAAEDLLEELRQQCYRLKSGFWTYELWYDAKFGSSVHKKTRAVRHPCFRSPLPQFERVPCAIHDSKPRLPIPTAVATDAVLTGV